MISATKARELPVLFNGDMVRAILWGRKTCTRRPVKHQPEHLGGGVWRYRGIDCTTRDLVKQLREDSPWKPGDTLYVRETFFIDDYELLGKLPKERPPYLQDDQIYYRADGEFSQQMLECDGSAPWRPSILMPKWLTRIRLEVDAVDPVQIQDIGHAEAVEEGIEPPREVVDSLGNRDGSHDVREWFEHLWESIYPGTWDRNIWVYANEFSVIEKPSD